MPNSCLHVHNRHLLYYNNDIITLSSLSPTVRPIVTVTYGIISTTTSNPTISQEFTDGDQGPQFSCSASGYFIPEVTWTFKGSEDLPPGVEVSAEDEEGRVVRKLVWKRQLEYTDSGQFKCTAANDNGTSTAAINITVISKSNSHIIKKQQFVCAPTELVSSPGLTTKEGKG